MPVLGLPPLVALVLVGLFVSACNEEPRNDEKNAQTEKSKPALGLKDEPVEPKAPRMLDPTKPGGSGTSKN
jgi:hypothetical protein